MVLMFLYGVEEHIFLPKTNQNAGFCGGTTPDHHGKRGTHSEPSPYPPMLSDLQYFRRSDVTARMVDV